MPEPRNPSQSSHGRICFVTSSFPRWSGDSSGTFVLTLAQDLASIGWEITVLAPHARGAARSEELAGIRVVRFRYAWPESSQNLCYDGGALINLRRNRYNWLKVPLLVAAEWQALWTMTRQHRIDLVHSHWIIPQGLVAAFVARPAGLPHVLTAHGSDVFQLGGGILRGLKRTVLRSADAVTVNSAATGSAVQTIAPRLDAPHLIPMGVSRADTDPQTGAKIRQQFGLNRTRPLIGFVGRMVAEKGVADLLQAIALLTPRVPGAALLLVGDGQEREQFQSLARDLNIQDRTRFMGAVPAEDVHGFMQVMDVVVLPSWFEAQGLTAIEALALAKPVVATAVGGLAELIEHGATGLLVPPRDPAALADAIERLVTQPPLACALGEAGREMVSRRYSRVASAQAFSDLYRLLLQRARQE